MHVWWWNFRDTPICHCAFALKYCYQEWSKSYAYTCRLETEMQCKCKHILGIRHVFISMNANTLIDSWLDTTLLSCSKAPCSVVLMKYLISWPSLCSSFVRGSYDVAQSNCSVCLAIIMLRVCPDFFWCFVDKMFHYFTIIVLAVCPGFMSSWWHFWLPCHYCDGSVYMSYFLSHWWNVPLACNCCLWVVFSVHLMCCWWNVPLACHCCVGVVVSVHLMCCWNVPLTHCHGVGVVFSVHVMCCWWNVLLTCYQGVGVVSRVRVMCCWWNVGVVCRVHWLHYKWKVFDIGQDSWGHLCLLQWKYLCCFARQGEDTLIMCSSSVLSVFTLKCWTMKGWSKGSSWETDIFCKNFFLKSTMGIHALQASCHLRPPLWPWTLDPACWLWKKGSRLSEPSI